MVLNIIRTSFALVFLMCVGLVNAQDAEVMQIAEYMPALEGCQTKKDRAERRSCTKAKIDEAVSAELKYPSEALKNDEEGVAVISITIDVEGNVSELMIEEDPGFGMGAAALKAVKKLSKQWYPAEHFGEKVAAQFKIPVSFVLPEEEEEPAPVVKPDVYTVVDEMPAYQGCDSGDSQCTYGAVIEYLTTNLKYPDEAKTEGIEGTVKARFVIDEAGAVTSVQLIEGIGGGCDEEALRLINEMPAWRAGVHQGEAVKVQYDLPVRFQIRGKE